MDASSSRRAAAIHPCPLIAAISPRCASLSAASRSAPAATAKREPSSARASGAAAPPRRRARAPPPPARRAASAASAARRSSRGRRRGGSASRTTPPPSTAPGPSRFRTAEHEAITPEHDEGLAEAQSHQADRLRGRRRHRLPSSATRAELRAVPSGPTPPSRAGSSRPRAAPRRSRAWRGRLRRR